MYGAWSTIKKEKDMANYQEGGFACRQSLKI